MPRYLVIHHAPGVTAEDFQKSVPAVLEGKYATFVQCYANLVDGAIVNIYDGESEQAVGARARAHRLPLRRDQGGAVRRLGRRSDEDDRRLTA